MEKIKNKIYKKIYISKIIFTMIDSRSVEFFKFKKIERSLRV